MKYFNPTAAAFGVAIAFILWSKVVGLSYLIKIGGQSQYHSIGNLANPDWAPKEMFRVVTLWVYEPSPDIPSGFYGLDTYDGFQNLTMRRHVQYWRYGILGFPLESRRKEPSIPFNYKFWPMNETHYDISAQVSLLLLGAANVSHILSPVPLKGAGIEKVSGPDDDQPFYRSALAGRDRGAYLRRRIDKIFDFGDVYIYSVPEYLPRAYPVREVKRVPDSLSKHELLNEIKREALLYKAVVRESAGAALDPPVDSLRVIETRKVLNGYEVDIHAPSGGVVALNASYVPFWQAHANGSPVEITPVNWVHMAVSVPPGTSRVEFQYRRPLLKDRLACAVGLKNDCIKSPQMDKVD